MGRHSRFFAVPREGDDRPIDRETVRRVVATFRPYKRKVGLVGILIVITSGLGVVNPLLIGWIFNQGLFGDPPGSCGGGACPDMYVVYLGVALMVIIPMITGVLGVAQTYQANLVGLRVMQDLRNALYAHLQHMPLRFFTSTRTGEIQSRLSNDVGGVSTVVTDTASSVLSNVVVIISTLIAMFWISIPLTLLSLCLLPVFLWLTVKVGRARREVASSTQKTMADMTSVTEETLSVSGILLSKAFGRQVYEIGRFNKENDRLTGLQIRQTMIGRSFFAVVGTFFSITPALVYLVAGVMLNHGNTLLSAGDLVAFTTLQSRLFFPIGSMLQVSTEVQSSLALFDRIFEYLDLHHEITDAPDAEPLVNTRGAVELEHVRFHYDASEAPEEGEADDREWTLDDVSLRIQPGQLAAFVGPSGAGKTTITYLVPRMYDVDEGAVRIDGRDVRSTTLASIADAIGIVTQETYLFHDTIRRNLLYGRPDATQEELEAAARAANIHSRIAELPEGYDTVVGERGYKLSGGEKQRLAIARVILKDPKILILDEATSSLDTTSRAARAGGARAPDAGSHHDRDRPPAVDDPGRRRDLRGGPRPDRRTGPA